ncbi:MAG: hypothetical protein RR014_06315, partial [Bilophila sp.]
LTTMASPAPPARRNRKTSPHSNAKNAEAPCALGKTLEKMANRISSFSVLAIPTAKNRGSGKMGNLILKGERSSGLSIKHTALVNTRIHL